MYYLLKDRSFDFHGIHGTVVAEKCVTYTYESLYVLQTSKILCFKPSLALRVLLLLAGDIETCPGPESLSTSEFKQETLLKGLKVGHQNIRGLEANFESFEQFLRENDLDVVGLSETHLCDSNITKNLKVKGYDLKKRNRTSGPNGGVCFYVKDGISFKERSDLSHDIIENIYIEISIKKSKPLIVGCFYRPPDSSKYLSKDFNDHLIQNIDKISRENKEMIIMGDFNIDYDDEETSRALHNDFKDIMSFHGLKQIITSSTRITDKSSTLIDHIFVSKPSNFPRSCVVATSLSDHDFVYCRRKINATK